MIDACDPDADLTTLRKLIKLNTGENIKLTKDEICQVYKNIQDEKLPLPPLILNKGKTYMTDRKSPLSVGDFEKLFDSSTKLNEIKRIARKVKLDDVDKKTKADLITAIGKRLRHLKVAEPIRISRKRVITKKLNRNDLNSAMNISETKNNLSNFGKENVENSVTGNNTGRNNVTGNNTGRNNVTGNNTGRNNFGNNIGRNNVTGNNAGRNNFGNNTGGNNFGNNTGRNNKNSRSSVNFPKESIFKSQPKPNFLKRSNSTQSNKVRFGSVFKRNTPSFLKRGPRRNRNMAFDGPGPVPNGPGPVPNGPGPVPNGPGPVPNGPRPVPNGPGPVPNGPGPGPVPNGPGPGPVPNGPRPGPVPNGPGPGPVPNGPGPGPVPNGPVPIKSKSNQPRSLFGGLFGRSNNTSKAKSMLKTKLKTLKKLRTDEVNMFLAKVSKADNINDIFEQARLKDQEKYTEESERIERKIQNAKSEEERQAAMAENRRIKKEKAAANIQARKNMNILKKEERRLNIASKADAIKNAKQSLRRNLDTLKQLSRSEKNSFLSRVRSVENIDDVFESASVLDKQRYDQKIQNAEMKASRARTEKERIEAKREKNRLEREQLQEEKKARLKVKQMRNQNVKNKLNNARAKQKMEKININSATKLSQLQSRAREKQLQTAKNSLRKNLGSLKKLSSSEKMAYVSRIRTVENIDDVFAEAQKLDQERYEQQLADLKKKNTMARNEAERKRIIAESKRIEKEQQNAKIRATSNLKKMRELERKYKNEERKQNNLNRNREKPAPPLPNVTQSKNKMKKAVGKISMLSALKKAGNNARQRRENLTGFVNNDDTVTPNKVEPKKPTTFNNPLFNKSQNKLKKNAFNAKGKFKGAVNKISAMKALEVKKNAFNAKGKFKGAVNKISAVKALEVKKNAFNAKGAMKALEVKKNAFNAKGKFKGAVNKISAVKALEVKKNDNFNAAAELNKQLNIKAKELNKANTEKKIRDGVEFKLKQIDGLTNGDVSDFMKKWNKSKNKTIFNQARKRGAGRLAGKAKTEERAKPKETNNFNAAAEMNKLNLAPTKERLLKKAKTEVGRFAGRIGKWDPAIKNAKDNATLTNLEKQLNKKIELRKEIQMSKIGPIKKRGHLEKVMELKNDVTQRRKIFEEQLKKEELKKYIQGLNIPRENKAGYVKRIDAPSANLALIRASANKQVNQKISNASKSLVAGAIKKAKNDEAATKIQAAFRGKKNRNKVARMKFEKKTNVANTFIPAGFDESKVFNNPLAAKPTKSTKVTRPPKEEKKKKKVSEATGAERVRLSREQAAAASREKARKAAKIEEKQKKRKAGPARNAKLAKELGISKKAAKKRRPKPK